MTEVPTVAFVHRGKPAPAQKNRGPRGQALQAAVQEEYRRASSYQYEGPCYGLVIYVLGTYNPAVHADADGISKRIWDGLEGVAYEDDHIVRLRTNGILERQPGEGGLNFSDFDLTAIPDAAAEALIRAVGDGVEDFLYVQLCGLRATMFNAAAALSGDAE